MKKYRSDTQIKLEIMNSIYNNRKNSSAVPVTRIMKEAKIGHPRLKIKLKELVERGAISQDGIGYFLTEKGEEMVSLGKKLEESFGMDIKNLEVSESPKRKWINITRGIYKSMLSKNYVLENGETNWVKLTYDYIMNSRKSGNRILDLEKMKSEIISAAENLRKNKFDAQYRYNYKNRIGTIYTNFIYIGIQTLV